MVRAGLEKGELNLRHLDQIINQPRPFNPVTGLNLITNHAFRRGFERALSRMVNEEWSAVLAEVRRMREGLIVSDELIGGAHEKTKSFFSIFPVSHALDLNVKDPKIFVNSSGEAFIFATENGKSILWEAHSGRKTIMLDHSEGFATFFERKNGQTILIYTRDQWNIISVFDVKSPKNPLFELDIRSIDELKAYRRLSRTLYDSVVTPVESEGKLWLAYHHQPREPINSVGKPAKSKPVVLIDMDSRAHSVRHLPNVTTDFRVLEDGRLYVAALHTDPESGTGEIFVREIVTWRGVFTHTYLAEEMRELQVHDVELFTEASGRPAAYLARRAAFRFHAKVSADSSAPQLLEPELTKVTLSMRDQEGRSLRAFIQDANGFHIGEREAFEFIKFPSGTRPQFTSVRPVLGTLGEWILFPSYKSARIKSVLIYNLRLGEWLSLPIHRGLDIDLIEHGIFYDRANSRILGFGRNARDQRLIPLQFFGPDPNL